MIQRSGSFEVLSRAKTSRKQNVIMTGKVEFIRDMDTIPSTSFDSVQSELVLNADDINTILKNTGFHLGECFQLLTAYIVKDSGYQTSGKYNPVTKSFQCNGIEIHDVQWKTNNRLKASKSSSSLKIRKMKFISYNNPSCQKLTHAPVIRECNTTECPLSSSMDRCIGKNEIVICTQLDSTSLTLMFSKKKRHSIKYLFVSKTQDSTNNIESRLLSVAMCNLPKSILKNQDWGSYIYLPTNHISSMDKIADNEQYINNIQPSIPISKVDPILTWMVPDEWKLAEAVTVPVIYAHVIINLGITYFLNLPDIEKMYLQKAIEEGILSGLVKPVPQKPNTVAVGKLKEYNKRSGDACVKIIEWLRKKDASNFVVILEKFLTNPRILAQMNRLLSDKNIIISFKTLNMLNSQGNVDQLIAETSELAPLDSVFFVSVHLNTIQKTGPVTLIGETWNAAVAIELSSMIKNSGRDFKLFILEGDPIEWKNTIHNLNLTNHREFENILSELYGDKIMEHLYPQKVEAKDQHHPNKIISNGNQPVNSAHVYRCLRLLKQLLINAHEYSLDHHMIENTVFFTKQSTHNTTLTLSNSSDVIHINEDGYDRFKQSSAIKKIIHKQAMFAWL
ncbi:hypothetical protein V9T40_014444 [Parthenolecanium corni]|uniref:Uncharacterized protein n=1 Tax=Parthenolecanium corni TaxID=536013 RepID=A0AAN9T4Z2_9HEMI